MSDRHGGVNDESIALGGNLTDQQHSALLISGVSVALCAGAGCGKTKTLTHAYLDRLKKVGPAGLERILTLTFTEKAARELRERVRRVCRSQLGRHTESEYWKAVLRGLEVAPIGTFHGFCRQLLTRFAVEAGLDPGFDVVEETIASLLRDEALENCARRWLGEQHKGFLDLAAECGVGGVLEDLKSLMEGRTRGDLQEWAERGADEIVRIWEEQWSRDVLPAAIQEFSRIGREVLSVLRLNPGRSKKMAERLVELEDGLEFLKRKEELGVVLDGLNEAARVQGARASDWDSQESYECVKEVLEKFRKEIGSLRAGLNWDPGATLSAARRGRVQAGLAVEAVREYGACKEARGTLDFDDLLLHTRDLLRNAPETVSRWLETGIEAVLVDEFQDTDKIQSEIVELLTREGWLGGSVFLVGDPKQSIYRFRGAQPRVFQEYREKLSAAGRADLTVSFRGVPGLLDFVNALFADVFPGEEHRLLVGRGTVSPRDYPPVTFLWARNQDRVPLAHERRVVEARWLARWIRQGLESGCWIVTGSEGEERPAQAGDITLLFRTLGDSAVYERAFADEGIEYHVVGGTAYFGQSEVLDVVNLLSTIDDPSDEIALVATLRSPFGCVSDEGLFWLSAKGQGLLIEGLSTWRRDPRLSGDDRKRAGRLHELLERWRLLKDRVPIAELLERALDESGYEAALMGEFLGERRRANVRKLVAMARVFDAEGGFTLGDFVSRLRELLRNPPKEEQAATSSEESGDAVRLMTIHQAKGLEFPIVIVPDLNRKTRSTLGSVVFREGLGVVTEPSEVIEESEDEARGESLGRRLLKAIEQREDREEALRVFYVATTRARDMLVLSSGGGAGDQPQSAAMSLLADRFDRAAGKLGASVSLPDVWAIPLIQVIDKEPGPSPSVKRVGKHRYRLQRWVSWFINRYTPSEEAKEATEKSPRDLTHIVLDGTNGLSVGQKGVLAVVRALLREATPPNAEVSRRRCELVAKSMGIRGAERTAATAHELLTQWKSTELAERVAAAGVILADQEWLLEQPREWGGLPVMLRGRADLMFGGAGGWEVVVVSVPGVGASWEILRGAASAEAARRFVGGDVTRVWRVVLDSVGASVVAIDTDSRSLERLRDKALGTVTQEEEDPAGCDSCPSFPG